MHVPIQDAFSKLLHIKDGRCLDFRACHDVGYQDAKFPKYHTFDKKLRDICLSLLFSETPGIWHYPVMQLLLLCCRRSLSENSAGVVRFETSKHLTSSSGHR